MGVQLFHGLCCFRRSFIFRCVVSHSTVSVVSRSRRYHARILGDRAHAVLFWIEFFNVKSCSRGRLGVLPLHSAHVANKFVVLCLGICGVLRASGAY